MTRAKCTIPSNSVGSSTHGHGHSECVRILLSLWEQLIFLTLAGLKKKKNHKKTAATFVLRYISLLLISHVFSRCVNDPHYAFFAGVLIVHSCPWTRYQFGFIHHARFPSTYFNFVYISITFSHFWVVETIPLSTPVVLFLTSLRRPLPRFGKLAPGIFFELYCSDFISP